VIRQLVPGMKRSLHDARPCGMTLAELLVVVAVIAALVALLLPAVHAAREAARRTACLNNLRNVGCGLHGHLLAKRRFPIGCLEWRAGWKPAPARCLAWSAAILPWLEEQPLHEQIDFDRSFADPANAAAAATRVAIYLCPSADRSGGPDWMGRTDYGGLTGERITSPNNPEKGVLIHDRAFAEREISDGLSKTIFVAECSRGPWPDGQWINGRNLFDQAYAINWPTWEDEIRSRHDGGAQALFGDGAVRMLSETTDLQVLAAACTRNGQEAAAIPGATP
jgi:prepilin-type N-terminal cleavage/methylation domain-containing protein/prepilin-type processing-associated H-X9-DG protein